MKRLGFRARLFLILALFAVVPAIVLTLAWGGTVTTWLPKMAGKAAWDTVSVTGEQTVAIARKAARTPADSTVIAEHERALANATMRSRQFEFITANAPAALILASLLLLAALAFLAARVAGHLSRQLSRPLDELVVWTGHIGRAEPLPASDARGAPEFGVLRDGMQQMAVDLDAGRRAALEAERLSAMRETARQVAHELKNPLTPIRFAIDRLRGRVPAELAEAVAVLGSESARLEQMARSFAQFGRLPDGPVAEVDLAELVALAVRSAVPPSHSCDVRIEPGLPRLLGQHDALGRALGNVLLNAVEACESGGRLTISARAARLGDRNAIAISIRDDGPGIDAAKLATMWDPYVTNKAGGTGLGLAIVRQTVETHGGTVAATSELGRGMDVTLTLLAELAGPQPS